MQQTTVSNWEISTWFNLLLINAYYWSPSEAWGRKRMQSSKHLDVRVVYTTFSLKCFLLFPALLSHTLLLAPFLRCPLLLKVFLQLSFSASLLQPQPFKAVPAQCAASFQDHVSSQMLPHPQLPLSFLNIFLHDASTTDNTVVTFVSPKQHLYVVICLKE